MGLQKVLLPHEHHMVYVPESGATTEKACLQDAIKLHPIIFRIRKAPLEDLSNQPEVYCKGEGGLLGILSPSCYLSVPLRLKSPEKDLCHWLCVGGCSIHTHRTASWDQAKWKQCVFVPRCYKIQSCYCQKEQPHAKFLLPCPAL